MKRTKKIILVSTITLISLMGYCQEGIKPSWLGNTSFGLSVYHIGSYAKQRPIYSIEQSFEVAPFEKIRFGLGTGLSLYPATLTIPVFTSVKYIITSKKKWLCSVTQSYGRNLKLDKLGFNSNRYSGNIGNSLRIREELWMKGELGYLVNWDKYGGGSISLILNFGISYKI